MHAQAAGPHGGMHMTDLASEVLGALEPTEVRPLQLRHSGKIHMGPCVWTSLSVEATPLRKYVVRWSKDANAACGCQPWMLSFDDSDAALETFIEACRTARGDQKCKTVEIVALHEDGDLTPLFSPIELDFSEDYRPLTYLRNDGAASLRMALKIVEQAHQAHAIAESRDQEANA